MEVENGGKEKVLGVGERIKNMEKGRAKEMVKSVKVCGLDMDVI